MKRAKLLMFKSLAASTRAGYDSGVRRYLAHCKESGIENAFPPTEDSLLSFVARLTLPSGTGKRAKPYGLKPATIRGYLTAVKNRAIELGFPNPISKSLRLERVMRGVKRFYYTQGGSIKPVPKQPITLGLLNHMLRFLPPDSHNNRVLRALLCLGIRGLFRLGELTNRLKTKASEAPKAGQWIDPGKGKCEFYLPVSKTDPFGMGIAIAVFPAPASPTCAVSAMREMIKNAPEATKGPFLFTLLVSDTNQPRPINRSDVVSAIKALVSKMVIDGKTFNPDHYSGHSLRRGGATSLAHAGCPDSIIQMLGRWESDCYRRYIESSPQLLRNAYTRLNSYEAIEPAVSELGSYQPSW
jgi:integrase